MHWRTRRSFSALSLTSNYFAFAFDNFLYRVWDLRPRWSTRRRAGFSCATLYFTVIKLYILIQIVHENSFFLFFFDYAVHIFLLNKSLFKKPVHWSCVCRIHGACTVHRDGHPLKTYTGCPRSNGQNFGRVFLMLNYTDITQNTYIQSWTVTEIMAREIWNFDSCYTLIDYQIHIKTGRNMWFL